MTVLAPNQGEARGHDIVWCVHCSYGVYIVPWAPTMRIDTSTASSTLLIVEI